LCPKQDAKLLNITLNNNHPTKNTMKKLIASVASAAILLAPNAALAQYGDSWDYYETKTFEYNKFIGDVWVANVDMKSGVLDNGVVHTEFFVNMTTPDCGEYHFPSTRVTLTATDRNSGNWVSGSDLFETYESHEYNDALISVEGYYLSDMSNLNLNVKTTSECKLWNGAGQVLDEADPSNIDPTDSRCSSNWLDYDCWGW
jgi:hypothetical protein